MAEFIKLKKKVLVKFIGCNEPSRMQTSGLVELNRFLFAACARACALTPTQTTAL